MTDIALGTIAAATAAGYAYTASTQADGTVLVTLQGQHSGGAHQSHHQMTADGIAATLNAATTAALAALNNQRAHRYGFGTTLQINDDPTGTIEVLDAT